MAAEPFAFDSGQLRAVIGHGFLRPDVWEQYDVIGIAADWFRTDAALAELWSHVAAFREVNGLFPAIEDAENNELVSFVASKFGPDSGAATPVRIKLCLESAKKHRLDVLAKKLDGWARFNLAAQTAIKIKEKYDAGEHDGIEDIILDAAVDVQKLDSGFGKHARDKLKSSVKRIEDRVDDKAEKWENKLSWGVTLLDDATDGIFRNDFWLLGARSGTGKTNLSAWIAADNSMRGKKVAAFFLEATEDEIEDRLEFGFFMKAWRADHLDGPADPPKWRHWVHGHPGTMEIYAPYKDRVKADLKAALKNLQTYYKTTKKFTAEDLQREILRIHKEVDLVVVDHFHFFDMKEGNMTSENAEATKLAATMRQVTISLGTPIVCVVHLNQTADSVMVPDLAHIHGSTNIHKLSTGVITIARAQDMKFGDAKCNGIPTFFRIPKGRTEQVWQTAVCFWDPDSGTYTPNYGLGKLNYKNSKWTETTDLPWWVNKERLVQGIKQEG